MKKRFMPLLLGLVLLLSMSCAACNSEANTQPEENMSTTEPTIVSTQSVTEAPEITPTELDWGMGEEAFDDNEKETEPVETQPSETEPAETQPAETEPAETEPTETEPAATEPTETESTDTEPSEPDWGMGGEDF